VLVQALMEIDPRFPRVSTEQREALQEVKQELVAQAPKGAAPDPFAERQREDDAQQDGSAGQHGSAGQLDGGSGQSDGSAGQRGGSAPGDTSEPHVDPVA